MYSVTINFTDLTQVFMPYPSELVLLMLYIAEDEMVVKLQGPGDLGDAGRFYLVDRLSLPLDHG